MSEETEKKRRHANHSTEEIREKHAKLTVTPHNTLRANRQAERALKNYLTETGATDIKFENFTAEKLAEILSVFYINVRTTDGKMYKISSLENFRHGLNRVLQGPPNFRKIDIIKDSEFSSANLAYKYALEELKSAGKGDVSHHPLISEEDLKKLYRNMNTDSPSHLQAKVQFDVRFYFFSRGSRKMHAMTKDTFVVKKDPNTGLRYVTKRDDEFSQNPSKVDNESYSAFMPECPGDPRCPVASFEKMLNHLHPQCDSLWQRPRDSFHKEGTIWFYKKPAGENLLSTFMKKLSSFHNLSQMYSNHSIRATGGAILSRLQFGNKQIMSVAGHKSVVSLSTYQKVSDSEKLQMGLSLNAALGTAPISQPTSSTVPAVVCALPTYSNPVVYCLPNHIQAPVGTEPAVSAPRTVAPGHKPLVLAVNTVPGTTPLSAPGAQKVVLSQATNQSIPVVSEKKYCLHKRKISTGFRPKNVS